MRKLLGMLGALLVGGSLWQAEVPHGIAVAAGVGVLIQVLIVASVLMMLADIADATGYLAHDRDEEWTEATRGKEPVAKGFSAVREP
jgi:hypothetical protein